MLAGNSNTELLFCKVAYKSYIVPWIVDHMDLNVAMFTYPLPKLYLYGDAHTPTAETMLVQ
jgi:hypothetical protein